ncbi:ribosome biogenesis protein BOP1 isoform X2 [Manis pentadactyla]|uniref:ribosome biogenesis protein BOP1 isoform X2 n=1 Tax=Manis pentadactyla TaxID=143292 RepID=UPI00255D0356|nr:ribosome biogenesis protein BOP1 isoform X2 [Manis pentadactyla]
MFAAALAFVLSTDTCAAVRQRAEPGRGEARRAARAAGRGQGPTRRRTRRCASETPGSQPQTLPSRGRAPAPHRAPADERVGVRVAHESPQLGQEGRDVAGPRRAGAHGQIHAGQGEDRRRRGARTGAEGRASAAAGAAPPPPPAAHKQARGLAWRPPSCDGRAPAGATRPPLARARRTRARLQSGPAPGARGRSLPEVVRVGNGGSMAGAQDVGCVAAAAARPGKRRPEPEEARTPSPRTDAASVPGDDEYAEDSSDEEDVRNTVGNVPLEWYDDFPHVGYDLDGRHIYKPLRTRDELDQFLDKMDDPDHWRTVRDRMTGHNVRLTDEQVALVQRLQRGQFGDGSVNPHEPAVDFFSGDLMIHPVTNRPADKRSFIPSLVEKEKVSRLVHAIKMGWVQPRRPRDPTPSFYDLWAQEDPNAVLGRHKMHVPAPKLALPGHAESYNPPPEYLPSEEERLAWEQQEPSERKHDFLPCKFLSLRAVPAYSRFIQERFERCLDLYLCPRQRKMRVNVDPEDLIPRLPRPRDLRPFPTCQALVYRGHSDLVRCLSVSPGGQWLASGSDDGSLRLWEVATARCMKTVPVGGVVKSVAWNPNPTTCLVAVAVEDTVLLLNPGLGDRLVVGSTDQLLGAFAPPEEPALQPARWREASEPERQRGLRLYICHDKPVTQATWHGRGDYMAVVLATSGHTQVLIHQLSRRRSQSPFRRSHGQVQRVAFHPVRPFLLAASQRSVRLYHLLRQELTKKLVPNCKWVSSLAVHPAGDNVICGSYDSKLVWFDLDLSTRPYRVLRHHKKALRAVAFHARYPLFASGSDDGSVIVCHGMVYNDLLQNPLLVPVKVLKGHVLTRGLGVLDVAFHPTQPWVFSSGADGTIRLFT